MQLKQSAIALLVTSLFISGGALAYGGSQGSDGGDIDDSYNQENGSNNHFHSNNGDDNNTISTNDGNDGNTWTSLSNEQTFMNEQSWSNKQSLEISVDMDTVVAQNDLSGEVSDTSVSYGATSSPAQSRGRGHGHDNSEECCGGLTVNHSNSLGGFNSAAGISTVAQNAGNNSLIQQAVSTNASVFTD
ncbi:hypothetical protein [Vibrio proteolyticus]|uniref:Uncharacterized protein n=1 Tax=Vibrio proteolyticus NBRC 13287 TaxID=1219065 RepID=U3A1J9_VIBPR|nr:hypothetical protein [Vibrio proteolyticus]GAD67222.1 hypothetical protein VPR01S_07_00210 [Vibrio proteolyticus NBRC 13287]